MKFLCLICAEKMMEQMPEVDTGRIRALVAQVRDLGVSQQVGPHAGVLGALAGIEKGDLGHALSLRRRYEP